MDRMVSPENGDLPLGASTLKPSGFCNIWVEFYNFSFTEATLSINLPDDPFR